MAEKRPHVVVLGAGFGGLTFCRNFNCAQSRVTLVDRENHHLFQPLLYQVATAGLSAPEIAQPIRSILADYPNITVLLDTVTDFDLRQQKVVLEHNCLQYDYLVLALGGVTSYFGHPEWEQFAPGLKSVDDALRIRRHVLLAFEKAENARDKAEHDRLMTQIVVGGGPTGVELAGALAELANHVLKSDFRHIDPRQARVVLIEANPRLLMQFPPELSQTAQSQLEKLGVEVRTSSRVQKIEKGCVYLPKETICAENIIWAAGISANPLTRKLRLPIDPSGRIIVQPDLSLPNYPNVFAIGDLARVTDRDTKPVPGVAPAAMQMARHTARIIEDEIAAPKPGHAPRPQFIYRDRGTMATIGRSAAVGKIGNLTFTGFPAWLAWLVVHLLFLIGLRNKLKVLLDWTYAYFAYKRGARIITGLTDEAKNQHSIQTAPLPPRFDRQEAA